MANRIKIENAKLIFRNFSGRPDERGYNAEGDRNFGVILNEKMVDVLTKDGWHIKRLPPAPDEKIGAPWLKVKVKYGRIPPIVEINIDGNITRLDESLVGQVDFYKIKNCDLVIRPYEYAPGKISAYLQSVVIEPEEESYYSF